MPPNTPCTGRRWRGPKLGLFYDTLRVLLSLPLPTKASGAGDGAVRRA
jgi:hypothetical protein